jgi:peptidoglycan hydrolase-like protein with peptidoglycan-binding domain
MKTLLVRRAAGIRFPRAGTLILGSFFAWSVVTWADDLTRAVQERLKDRGFYYGQVDGQGGSETSAAIRRYQIRYGLKVNGELNQETLNSLGLSATNLPPASSATPRMPESNQPGGTNRPNATPPPAQRNRVPSNGDEEYVDPRNYPSDGEPRPRSETINYRVMYAGTLYAFAPDQVQQNVMRAVQNELARWGFYRAEIDGNPGPETIQALREFQRQRGLWPTGKLDNWTLQALRAFPGQRNGPRIRRRPIDPRFGPDPYSRGPQQETWVD